MEKSVRLALAAAAALWAQKKFKKTREEHLKAYQTDGVWRQLKMFHEKTIGHLMGYCNLAVLDLYGTRLLCRHKKSALYKVCRECGSDSFLSTTIANEKTSTQVERRGGAWPLWDCVFVACQYVGRRVSPSVGCIVMQDKGYREQMGVKRGGGMKESGWGKEWVQNDTAGGYY